VLSGRGLCDKLITHPQESYRLSCVVMCDQAISRMRRPWPALGRSATRREYIFTAHYLHKNTLNYTITRTYSFLILCSEFHVRARRTNFLEVARVTELAGHSRSVAYYAREQRARKLYAEQDKASPYRFGIQEAGLLLLLHSLAILKSHAVFSLYQNWSPVVCSLQNVNKTNALEGWCHRQGYVINFD